jgi:hypothetical protein
MKIAQEELGKPLVKQLEDNQLATPGQESLKRRYHYKKSCPSESCYPTSRVPK